MREHKRIIGKFTWVPMDKRKDRFGLPLPPRKAEKRTPKYWLIRAHGHLYFINNTNDIIDFVSSSTGGFTSSDDDTLMINNGVDSGYHYKNVMPQEAIKIEEYDDFYDLDYVLWVEIVLKSEQEGTLQIQSPSEKGGIKKEAVLLWNTGEIGKFVSMQKI